MAERSRKPVVRVAVAALAVPVATLIAAVLVLRSWWDDLPELIASHWSATGQPDGFSTARGVMAWLAGIGVGVVLTATWGALAQSAAAVRLIVPMVAGAGAFLQAFLLAAAAPQRGVADATVVTLPGWAFLWAAVAGVAGGLITLWLLPRWTSQPLNGVRPADAGALGDTEPAVWTQVVTVATPGVVVAGSATLLVVAATVIAGVRWMLLLAVLLVLTMVATLSVRVVVDASGLRIVGRLGWPRLRIDVADIESVATADVHALREFGGWGYRVALAGPLAGAKGFVLRSGPAIVVTRRSGATEVIAVHDAEIGAGLLEAYRQQATPG